MLGHVFEAFYGDIPSCKIRLGASNSSPKQKHLLVGDTSMQSYEPRGPSKRVPVQGQSKVYHMTWPVEKEISCKEICYPGWNYCKENPLPCHPPIKNVSILHLWTADVAQRSIDEAIKIQSWPYKSFRKKLSFEDEETWLVSRSCKQLTRKLISFYAPSILLSFSPLTKSPFWAQNEQSCISNFILSI